jgi:hypothetical protein
MWTGGAGASPAVAQGQQWIGHPVRKNFDGVVHEGSVIAYDSAEGLFAIKYAGGDQEDVELDKPVIELQFPADPPASGDLAVPDSHHN